MPQPPITPQQAERIARSPELAAMIRTAVSLNAVLTTLANSPELAASITRLHRALGAPEPDRRSRPRRLRDAVGDRLRWWRSPWTRTS